MNFAMRSVRTSVRNNSFSESVHSADDQSSRASSSRTNSISSISSLDEHQQDKMLLKLVKSLSKEAKKDLAIQASLQVQKLNKGKRRSSHQEPLSTSRHDEPLFDMAEDSASSSSSRVSRRK